MSLLRDELWLSGSFRTSGYGLVIALRKNRWVSVGEFVQAPFDIIALSPFSYIRLREEPPR